MSIGGTKFALKKTARKKSPVSFYFFEEIKNNILGRDYELSLMLIGSKLSKQINKKYRKNNKPTNVLSFPLDKKNGEIFIDLGTSRKESPRFGMSYKNFVIYLFIHGCLHLKGMDHGSRMDKEEKKLLKKYSS